MKIAAVERRGARYFFSNGTHSADRNGGVRAMGCGDPIAVLLPVRVKKIRYRSFRPAERAAILAASDYRCSICRARALLQIDHDHRTGRIRGVLCRACNRGLGHFADEPSRLRIAAAYLEVSR